MSETKRLTEEQLKDIKLGETAEKFLQSPEWIDLVKPIIDSMLLGVKDVTGIKITSEKQAQAEIIGRTLTAGYLSEIETLIQGYVDIKNSVVHTLQKKEEPSLYKHVE